MCKLRLQVQPPQVDSGIFYDDKYFVEVSPRGTWYIEFFDWVPDPEQNYDRFTRLNTHGGSELTIYIGSYTPIKCYTANLHMMQCENQAHGKQSAINITLGVLARARINVCAHRNDQQCGDQMLKSATARVQAQASLYKRFTCNGINAPWLAVTG